MHVIARYNIDVFLSLLLITLIAGCKSDFALEDTIFQPRLAVNSAFSTFEEITVDITSTQFPSDTVQAPAPKFVIGWISPTSSNVAYPLLHQSGNTFFCDIIAREGESYTLEISAEGYPEVFATTTVPQNTPIEGAEIKNLVTEDSETTAFKTNIAYDLAIDLEEDGHRYFHILFTQTIDVNINTPEDPVYTSSSYFVEPEDLSRRGLLPHHEAGVLIDMQQSGYPDQITFRLADFFFNNISIFGDLLVEVRTVSEEYYSYYNSLSRQLTSRLDPFAEPIPIHSNIENGSGVFGGYATQVLVVQIPL